MKPDKTSDISYLSRFYYFIQLLFLKLVFFIINALSPQAVSDLADLTGSALFLRKRRRDFSINNLCHAFPEKSLEEVKKIGRGSMRNMIRIIFEVMRIPRIAKNPEASIEIKGEENVWNALAQGRGLILAVSHFGNWELAGIAISSRRIPLYAVGKSYKNSNINRYIRQLRGMTGLETINQQGAVRKSIELIKENKVIGMLIDEHAKKGAVWVDLFGQKAATSALPAMLALKYKTPIISMFFYREKNKRSVIIFDKPFQLIETGNYDSDVQANTQQYMTRLEQELIKRPEDWTLWMHNRWRWEDQIKKENPTV